MRWGGLESHEEATVLWVLLASGWAILSVIEEVASASGAGAWLLVACTMMLAYTPLGWVWVSLVGAVAAGVGIRLTALRREPVRWPLVLGGYVVGAAVTVAGVLAWVPWVCALGGVLVGASGGEGLTRGGFEDLRTQNQ